MPVVRAVVQRVTEASVTVDGEVVGRIGGAGAGAPDGALGLAGDLAVDQGQGLLVLVGVATADTPAHATRLAAKVHELRILDGERSAAEAGAPLLVVSQFTLYGDTRKGRRPTWSAAAPGPLARPLVEAVVAALRGRGAHVETGRFGAHMRVSSVNDGPVTLLVEV